MKHSFFIATLFLSSLLTACSPKPHTPKTSSPDAQAYALTPEDIKGITFLNNHVQQELTLLCIDQVAYIRYRFDRGVSLSPKIDPKTLMPQMCSDPVDLNKTYRQSLQTPKP